MPEVDKITQELATARDELKLKMHLASKDLQDEWDSLEEKYDEVVTKAKLDETAEGLGAAGALLIDEIKKGYERIKAAID
ncbi:MAG: hypothetical protein ACR2OR_13730 [Hyphomicrobiales bacterium]